MNSDTQQIIEQLSNQAAYYKQKADELENQKIKQKTEVDSIVVVFAGCVFCLLIFVTYGIVSSVSSFINSSQTGRINNVQ